jgi:hypothetical protein
MNLIRKYPHAFIYILSGVFIALLAWVVLRAQTGSSQPPSTPALKPDAGFTINIPQKALWRNYVTVSMEAIPGQHCELTYIPPSGEVHRMDTLANEAGICEWKWKIEESEGKGSGRLIFTLNGKSETHFFEIRSSF